MYQYKYNGKEWQDELNLNWYNYGWRNYDPAIARWVNHDPLLSELKFHYDNSVSEDDDQYDVYMAIVNDLELGGGIYNVDNLNPYGYGYNNPVSFDDPDGRCPVCLIFVAVYFYSEFANAPTGKKEIDGPNYEASKGNKTIVSETILRRGVKKIDTGNSSSLGVQPKKEAKREATDKKTNPRNPDGSKGKPDHQEKVKELEKKAAKENPDKDIVTEKKINAEGSNRRPDVQAVDKKTKKTTKIYEAERRPNSKRNKDREEEYKKLGIPNETHKVGD